MPMGMKNDASVNFKGKLKNIKNVDDDILKGELRVSNLEAHTGNVFLGSGSSSRDTARSYSSFIRLQENDPSLSEKPVIFFDLDNTLYGKETGVAEEMGERIKLFFMKHLNLPREDSEVLGRKYYLDYGLAIKGLIKHFSINPATYDRFVDGGLSLEERLEESAELFAMIQKCHARKWILTNAGKHHAQRTLKILGLYNLFEGIIYCDYEEPNFPAKPDLEAYERAMDIVGIQKGHACYFIDDSKVNVEAGVRMGWSCVLLDQLGDCADEELKMPTKNNSYHVIKNILEVSNRFPDLFSD